MKIIIRSENEINYTWATKGIGNNYNFSYEKIPKAGNSEFLNLPEKIKNILRLDKPDIIISKIINNKEIPLISIEITKSKPASQHIEQRMPRIIAAAESGVSAIYICPKKINNFNFNLKHYDLMHKIGIINKIPTFFFHYPNNNNILLDEEGLSGCPKIHSEQMENVFCIIKEIINEDENRTSLHYNLFNNKTILQKFENQKILANGNKYMIENLPSCEIIDTKNIKNYLSSYMEKNSQWINSTVLNLPQRITSRSKTIIFKPQYESSRLFDHAGDPYTGMLGAFDYAFCRIGKNIEDRDTNLIYMPQNINDSYLHKVFSIEGYNNFYINSCPFKKDNVANFNDQFKISHHLQYGCVYTKNKPLRIYGYFCDLLLFKDAVLIF